MPLRGWKRSPAAVKLRATLIIPTPDCGILPPSRAARASPEATTRLGGWKTITTTPAADAAQSYTYTYNDLNQRTRVTREDGSYWSYIYNDRGELVSGKKYWADNSIVWGAQTEYSFDNIGNRKYAKNGGNQLGSLRQSNYTTNSLNQYPQRTVPGAVDVTGTANTAATVTVNNQATARRSDYFYKELAVDNSTAPANAQINVVGARNNFGAGGEDAVTEKGGRVFVPQAPELFTYDYDGNLTSDGRWNYTWDAENRLLSMEAIASVPPEAKQRLEFSYDHVGRRLQKKVYAWSVPTSSYQLQSLSKFVYDGWNLMAELEGTNQLVRSYVWGTDLSSTLHGAGGIGGLLSITEAGVVRLAGHDGLSITALVSASDGLLSAEYDYDPFGSPIKSVGAYADTNPLRFSSKYLDRETNLIYFGHRYYNSEIGRWISKDPLAPEDENNLYAYVANSPTNSTDPDGLQQRREWRKVVEVDKESANWDAASGQMDYTYHRIGLCIPDMDLERALNMIYSDFETFAHFNEPTANIAKVSILNNGQKAHFSLNPSFSASAAWIAGNSIDVALAKYPASRELFAMTIGDHPLVGVRKWAVRKREDSAKKPCKVDIDTDAYEQANGLSSKIGRAMTGRDQQNSMWSTYMLNIAEHWKRNHKAQEIDRDFRQTVPAGRNDNPYKSRLPADLQKTKMKERVVHY